MQHQFAVVATFKTTRQLISWNRCLLLYFPCCFSNTFCKFCFSNIKFLCKCCFSKIYFLCKCCFRNTFVVNVALVIINTCHGCIYQLTIMLNKKIMHEHYLALPTLPNGYIHKKSCTLVRCSVHSLAGHPYFSVCAIPRARAEKGGGEGKIPSLPPFSARAELRIRKNTDGPRDYAVHTVQCSLVPRPSAPSAPCALRVIIKCGGGENGGRRPGRIYHVIRGTGVTRSSTKLV